MTILHCNDCHFFAFHICVSFLCKAYKQRGFIMKKIWIGVILVLCVCILTLTAWITVPRLFVDLYSEDGKTVSAWLFDVEEYKNNGWYETPVVTMYAPDGQQMVVNASEMEEYQADGWYEEPVTVLYQIDGNSEVVLQSQAEAKLENGWFLEPVAQMTKNGETKTITVSQTDSYRKEGWNFKEYCVGLPELSRQIQDYIATKTGNYGVYVKNLNTGDLLVLNDGKFPAASVIKLYQMAAIYDEIHKGNLTMNSDTEFYLHEMITVSDNYASNELVRIIGHGDYRKGFDILNRFADATGCINTQQLSLFSEAGYFVAYGSNRVSPYDCGQILEQIYRRTLISPQYSDEMLALLKQQTRQHKIPYPLPEGVMCANKTGETSTIENDVAIVYSPACDYIICVMTNNAPSGIYDIRDISQMTYQYFNP